VSAPITTLSFGDTVPIGTVLANLIIMGIVTDINNPNMFAATLQAYQDQAVLTVPVLQGIQGNPGQMSFALRWQNPTVPLAGPANLPTNLTNLATDLGKYWTFSVTDQNGNTIATVMYVWYGTIIGFVELPVGSPGPPGASPVITPILVLQEPNNGLGPNGVNSWIQVTGTVSNPTYTFNIAAPQGIAGPPGTLFSCPDINFVTTPPEPGDALICTSTVVPGAPTGLTINPLSTGGTLAAGTWFYSVTALVTNGESLQANEVEATTVGSTSSIVLAWNAPSASSGATGYNIYRGSAATNLSVRVGTVNSGTTTTFTDTGFAGTPASPPSAGVVAGRSIWGASAQTTFAPQLFTVPQSAFTSIEGIGAATQPICTFAMPQQPWPWVPVVFGSLAILGFDISLTSFLIGAQVLLGNVTTGTLVAAGAGNAFGSVLITPQASTISNASTAITPTNGVGVVPANHTGNQGTIYVSLVQQGLAGVYDFSSAGASLSVLVVPVPNG
jgi:hypothetical protein